ncbi:hypothetical protein [Alkalibacillus salilacus]|uniref:Uncharacterized protein n=1 Tax=Alkalibacillus salilacus TaxID=284582 RepID=A0ABT9VFZ2_9BACI|nr:hypothetical protein [Alkalibacillus salilacus]MDQ0159898.1 hypothetical protein [Alkalibacillus salilacus]
MAIKQWLYHTFWNKNWKKLILILTAILIVTVVILVTWTYQHPLTNYIKAEKETLERIEDHFWIDQPIRSSINDQLASDPSITDYEIGLVGSSSSSQYQTMTSLLMSTSMSAERKMNPNIPHAHYDWQIATLGLNWLEGSVYQDEQLTVFDLSDWLHSAVGFDQTNASYIPSLYKQRQSTSEDTDRTGLSAIQMFMEFLQELEVEETSLNHQENQIELTLSESQANEVWQQALANSDSLQQEELKSYQVDGEMVYSATYENDFVSDRTWETTVVNGEQVYDVQVSIQSNSSNGDMVVDGQVLVTNEDKDTVLDIRFDASSDELLDDQVKSEQTLIIDYPILEFAEGVRLDWQTNATSDQSETSFEVKLANNEVSQWVSGQLVNHYSKAEETSTHDTELYVSIEDQDALNQELPFEDWELSVERQHQFSEEVNIQTVDRGQVEMFEPDMLKEWEKTLKDLTENPEQLFEDQLELPF